VTKTVGGSATHIGSSTTALPTFTAGTWIRVRARFSGTSPTTIRLRVWADGTPEPWNWGRTETDSTAALQVASQAGVRMYPSDGFSYPITMNIDDVAITSISGDATAPTTPTGLTATADGSSAINLAWTASTDAVGVQGYRIFRGGSYLATTGSTSWTDTGLAAATNYSYTVVALDAATNLSAQSGSAAATTGPASITTEYSYDDNGNRERAWDGTLEINTTYDRLNRPLTVDDEDAGTTADTTYTYSLTSPSWTDPTGTYLVALDKFDRPTSVDGPVAAAFTTTYRADGQPDASVAPNGNTTDYDYDRLGRETVRATSAAGVDRAVYGLIYNRAGSVLSESSTISGDPTNGDTTYTYDPLGRLASFTRAATPTAYAWEAFPNRASVQVGAGTPVTTTYDAANRPVSDSAGGTYASDDDGRLTARPGQRLGWDNLGRLTSVRPATGSATTATYAYDPLDRLRLVDYGSGVRVRFRYVGLTTSVAQTIDDASGSVLRHVATGWTGERLLDWTDAGANLRFYGTNAHHDVTWLGSSAGTVSATLRYDPFGVVTSTTGASLPEFRFQSSWADSASSLSWVVTRWYAPSLGRFVSEDSLLGQPIDPPSRHLYAYAEGEPVGAWDPDGMNAVFTTFKLYRLTAGDGGKHSSYGTRGWRLTGETIGPQTAQVTLRAWTTERSLLTTYKRWKIIASAEDLFAGGTGSFPGTYFGGGWAGVDAKVQVDVYRKIPGKPYEQLAGRELMWDWFRFQGLTVYQAGFGEVFRFGEWRDETLRKSGIPTCGMVCTTPQRFVLKPGHLIKIRTVFSLRVWSAGMASAKGRMDIDRYRLELASY
jgi:RHS repeat-associated protein